MEQLPVLHLTQLLTKEEIKNIQGVNQTHDAGFCPIGVSLSKESDLSRCYYGPSGKCREERYTPLAYFAVSVWKKTVEKLSAMEEFADALQIEWYPVAASFRSVRYLNDVRDKYIRTFRSIAREIANSREITVHYGTFAAPALPEAPDFPIRIHIIPLDLLAEKRCYGIQEELKDLPKDKAFSYSWEDIQDFFVELNPQQLAFNAGSLMNNPGTELDQQFIRACAEADLPQMKKLFKQGANIHAVDERGDMAANNLIVHFYDECPATPTLTEAEKAFVQNIYRKKTEALTWLIQQGYDLNLCAYDACTPLYDSVDSPDISIMKCLLENGADPNIISWINVDGYDECSALEHVWSDYDICFDNYPSDLPRLDEMEELLKRYGAKC